MRGTLTLYLDQYGNRIFARTLQELQQKAFGGKVSKMYSDTKDGRTLHVGYVIGKHWFSAFRPFEQEA